MPVSSTTSMALVPRVAERPRARRLRPRSEVRAWKSSGLIPSAKAKPTEAAPSVQSWQLVWQELIAGRAPLWRSEPEQRVSEWACSRREP